MLPGREFAGRALTLTRLRAGSRWRRIHARRHADALGHGTGLSRFSDPTGAAFGVVYLGCSAKVAFVETVLRDRADGRTDQFVIEMAELAQRSLATVVLARGLRVIDLTGDGRLTLGVPSDVSGARDQTLSRAWSLAFHSHPSQPDGVLYASRLNGERCLAVYARAVPRLRVVASVPLLEAGAELDVILDDLEIALI
jgi:hypothetical protein